MKLSHILRDREKLRVRLLAAELIGRPGEGLLARRWLSPDRARPVGGAAAAPARARRARGTDEP